MPFFLILLLFLSSTVELFSTAVSLQILFGPNNTLIFLIGEHHGLPNSLPGDNKAAIQKLLTILRNSEKQSGGGFRIFVESYADQIFKRTEDLLDSIITERESLSESTFEDLEELRSIPTAASHIFMYPTPFSFSLPFRYPTPSSVEEDAEFRDKCLKRYRCNINTLTFNDVLALFEKQLEIFRNKKNEWPRGLHSLLAQRLKAIEQGIKGLHYHLDKFKIDRSESIITEAIRLYQEDSVAYMTGYMYSYMNGCSDRCEVPIKQQIKIAIDWVNNDFFDLIILDRILQACSEDSSKPIIVIAGDGHTRELVNGLKELGCTPLHDIRERIGNSSYLEPMKPEVLAMIEQPQELFAATQQEMALRNSWYPCLIL